MNKLQPYVYPQLTPAPHSLGLFGFVPAVPKGTMKYLPHAVVTVDGIDFYQITYHYASDIIHYAQFDSNVELDLYTIGGKQS